MPKQSSYTSNFPVLEYYEKCVIPLNRSRFKIAKGMMVCPFHEDHDPSLGVIVKKSGGEICHCFGCNYIGDIVKVHKDIVYKYQNRYISFEDSLQELCNIFGVDRSTLVVDDLSAIDDSGTRQELELLKAFEDFDIGDYRHLIGEGKKNKKSIGYFNALLMTMVDKYKEDE